MTRIFRNEMSNLDNLLRWACQKQSTRRILRISCHKRLVRDPHQTRLSHHSTRHYCRLYVDCIHPASPLGRSSVQVLYTPPCLFRAHARPRLVPRPAQFLSSGSCRTNPPSTRDEIVASALTHGRTRRIDIFRPIYLKNAFNDPDALSTAPWPGGR